MKVCKFYNIILQININNFIACPLFLTVSLEGKNLFDTKLELNWGPDCHDVPQWIGIFREDPSISNIQPEQIVTNEITNSSGKLITNIKLEKMKFPLEWQQNNTNISQIQNSKSKCLPYYVASFNENELLMVECLKIYPNWMNQTPHVAQMQLKNLFIPGLLHQ